MSRRGCFHLCHRGFALGFCKQLLKLRRTRGMLSLRLLGLRLRRGVGSPVEYFLPQA